MNAQPEHEETEHDLPDSNTLGGTTSTGAGPDGDQVPEPAPETTGLGYEELDQADDVTRRVNERNQENQSGEPDNT